MVHNDPLGGRAAGNLQNRKQDSIILTLKPRKGSCMDNLAQTLLAALKNTEGEGKISIDAAIKEAIRHEIESAVNQIIAHELTVFLGYEKNEQGASAIRGDARNGSYERRLGTTYGEITVSVPRDRNGEFETRLLPRGKRSTDDIGQTVLKLYRAGMTDSQIQEIVESLFHHRYSDSTISFMTDAVKEDVERFRKTKVKERYFALFADAIYVPLRRETVEKEAVSIVMGIDMEGYPEVLAFSIQPEETKEGWKEILQSLRERGLKSARILVSDGFAGIGEIVSELLPGCLHQRCYLHLARNLMEKVRADDRKPISWDFMQLAKMESGKEALGAFEAFLAKWGAKYKSVKRWGEQIDRRSVFAFYRFPKGLRKVVYSNNRIEGFNKEIRRQAKAHVQFCSEDAEEKFLVTLFNRYNFRVGKRAIKGREILEEELLDF